MKELIESLCIAGKIRTDGSYDYNQSDEEAEVMSLVLEGSGQYYSARVRYTRWSDFLDDISMAVPDLERVYYKFDRAKVELDERNFGLFVSHGWKDTEKMLLLFLKV